MAEWVTPAQVAVWANTSESDHPGLGQAVKAARAWVERKRSDLDWAGAELPEGDPARWWPSDDLVLGACMLAWRWYQRYAQPNGMAGYPEMASGGILRHDPDIAQLLGIGWSGAFVFAAARPPDPVPVVEP